MPQRPARFTRQRAFVLRVWQDGHDRTWGHLTEPGAEWRTSFHTADELFGVLRARLMAPDPVSTPIDHHQGDALPEVET